MGNFCARAQRGTPPKLPGAVWGAYHLHRKTGNSGWKIKWYVIFRSERSGKSGRSFEVIHFSRSFRFSRLVCVPFDSIHLDLIVFCAVRTKWRPKIKAKVGENYICLLMSLKKSEVCLFVSVNGVFAL